MAKIDPDFFLIFSELFVNLAAGWFGTIIVLPILRGVSSPMDIVALFFDLIAGTLSLVLSFLFKKLSRKLQ